MRKSHALIASLLLALTSATAFAGNPGTWQYNPNSDKWNCVGGSYCDGSPGGNTGGNGGNGGNGGAGGDATAVGVGIGVGIANAQSSAAALASATNRTEVDVRNTNTNLNSNVQGQVQGQQQAAIANGNVLNVAEGAVNNTVTSGNATATVGDVSATGGNASATGGAGGQAVSAAVVESGAASAVVETGAVQYTYNERLQAPSIGQGSFAITGCSVAGNAGGSGPGWSGFLGFGFTPSQCYDFMLAQAYQSIGEKKAVCDILKNSKAGKRQAKRGVVLPECVPVPPEVKTVVVEAPPKTVYVEVPPAKISE